LISEQIDPRIQGDQLALCIVQLVEAMRTDFGQKFKAKFQNENDLRQYKRRLYAKLRGRSIPCIRDGYERYVDSGAAWPPEIPELVDCVAKVEALWLANEKRRNESDHYAALPAPTMTVDALALLAEAKAKADARGPESLEERQAKLAALEQNHNAVLALHGRNIQRRVMADHQQCAFVVFAAMSSVGNEIICQLAVDPKV